MADDIPLRFLECNYREEPNGPTVALDLYLPPLEQTTVSDSSTVTTLRPTIVFFHGGGLTAGDKTSWFPTWIHARAMAAGYAFVSPDYQLMPPGTGYQILEDINSLFSFLQNKINDLISSHGRHDGVDAEKIIAVGNSSGALCAYLAGIHARPKPKCIISIYGMGGDLLTRHYLFRKYVPFFLNREILCESDFAELMYPRSLELPPITSSKPTYYGPDYHIPGYPSNPRHPLTRLYLQLGIYLDYYTGVHNPGISEQLRPYITKDLKQSPPPSLVEKHYQLFPQFNISALPPTFFIHGAFDTAILAEESQSLYDQLQAVGTCAILKICEGMEHSFDYRSDAEQLWGDVFDEAFTFAGDQLR